MSGAPLIVVCTCHGTLSPILKRELLEKGIAGRLPDVRVEFAPSLCKRGDFGRVSGLARQDQPRRVLLAACSPFAKGRVALNALSEMFPDLPAELVDLREGCAWIHAGAPDAATAKAVDLVCMGMAAMAVRQRSPKPDIQVEQRVLVVGAGPAGLAAAGTLARLGVPVTLADRLARPGGLLNQVGKLFPANIASEHLLAPLLQEIAHPAVDFLPKAQITRIEGDPGRFEAYFKRDGQDASVVAGAVILACGALPVLPENRFRSGEISGVISQLELETRLKKLEAPGSEPPQFKNAVFIQCMAARDDDHPYCSTICCPTALKNGIRLKELHGDIAVTVVHRGIMAPGKAMEELYRKAMAAGVRFVAYSSGEQPEVRGNGSVASVVLNDALSGRRLELPADVLVLSTPLKPRPETTALAVGLGVRLDNMGFACGCEPMRPLAAPVHGVYLCGAVRWPVYADHAVDQGRAAAVKAAGFLEAGRSREGVLHALALPGPQPGSAAVDSQACSRCGQCIALCPYGACRRGEDGTARVSGIRCRGCGLCASVCPSGAIRVPENNVPLRAMLREIAPRINR